jgi:Tol biopolymer transport system component
MQTAAEGSTVRGFQGSGDRAGRTTLSAVAALFAAAAIVLTAQSPKSAAVLMQAAAAKATIEGDFKGAAELYDRAVAQAEAEGNRALAASALVAAGEAYLTLRDQQASHRFERVVREFTDQPDVVARARRGLPASKSTAGHRPAGLPAFRHLTTFGPSDLVAGDVSADGRYAPFIRWNEGALFVRDLTTGGDWRVTPANAPEGKFLFHPEEAAISRDGKRVAYNWFQAERGYELRMVEIGPRALPEPRVLYASEDVKWIMPDDWAPDSSWIAVTVERKDGSVQLGRLSVPGRQLDVLKTFPDWRGLGAIAISPDGRFVAFDTVPVGTFARDIVVLPADRSRELAVVTDPADDMLVGWAPGGGVLFASDRAGSPGLWLQPFDGTTPLDKPTQVYQDAGHFQRAGLSADGSMFALPIGQRTADLKMLTVDFATGSVLDRPVTAPGVLGGLNHSAEWSIDGKQLAYIAWRRLLGGRTSFATLIVQKLETGLTYQVQLDAQSLAHPKFSPDGKRLVVVGYNTDRQSAFLIDHTTGETSVIATAQGPEERLHGAAALTTSPVWSHDGRTVYFRRVTQAGHRLFAFDVASRREREIFASADPQGNSTVSPDGKRVFFRRLFGPSSAPVGRQLAAFVERDLSTGVERELVRRLGLGATVLSPDGRYIITGSEDEATNTRAMLLVSTIDGTTHELLRADIPPAPRPGNAATNPIHPLAWAPDSRSVLIKRVPKPGEGEIWWAPVDGRAPRRLLNGTESTFGGARIHPDGRRVVYSETESSTAPEELRVLERFLPSASTDRR